MKKIFSDEPIFIKSIDDVNQLKNIYPQRQTISFTCSVCGQTYTGLLGNFKSLVCKSCNMKSSAKNVDLAVKNEKRLKTCIEKYGSLDNYKRIIKEKSVKTCIERYGCECSFQNNDVKNKIRETWTKKYGSVDEAYITMKESREKTLLAKYGVTNVSYMQDAIAKRKQTYYEHCKDPNFLEVIKNKCRQTINAKRESDNEYDKKILEKRKNTLLARYNVDHNFKIPSVIEHRKQYFIETYGFENPVKNESVKLKQRETLQKRTPEEWAIINKKRKKKLMYNDIMFDSYPEVCFYIFLEDFDIDFIYQPEAYFTYEYNGIQHKYFPDFLIGDTFYELKGDMFFDGENFVNPWDRSPESDELNKLKYQCMKNNNIKILRSKDYKVFVDYVVSTKNILREDLLYVE